MKNMTKLLIALSLLASFNVLAVWDGSVTGKVSQIHVTGGNNYGFRITIEGQNSLCGNDNDWAYVNESDSNYKTYVSVLTAAKAAGQTVRILTTRQNGDANGYCHIGYVFIL
jgi:hypothetical protein